MNILRKNIFNNLVPFFFVHSLSFCIPSLSKNTLKHTQIKYANSWQHITTNELKQLITTKTTIIMLQVEWNEHADKEMKKLNECQSVLSLSFGIELKQPNPNRTNKQPTQLFICPFASTTKKNNNILLVGPWLMDKMFFPFSM